MKTLESIFSEIKERGVITKQQLQLLKTALTGNKRTLLITIGWKVSEMVTAFH